jgi:hypothetical protein
MSDAVTNAVAIILVMVILNYLIREK